MMGIWKVRDGMAFKTRRGEHVFPGKLVDDQKENIRNQMQKVQPVDDAAKKTYEGFKKGVWSVYEPLEKGPEVTKEDIKREQDLGGGGQDATQAELEKQLEESKGDDVEEAAPDGKPVVEKATEDEAKGDSEEVTKEDEKTEATSAAPDGPAKDKAIPGVKAKKSK